ncbi:MAG: threonine synthase [Parcubacteria group bacterium RIFCSPHIGHO2_02_FULL_48_10b]|nr:MAG: threonine synthase [Parcubacteria group bacterium RIFCSPHIGHO2_02_FULL_48_10b]
MKYYSTNKRAPLVTFKEALLRGLAPDGGLYMPQSFPKFPISFWNDIEKTSSGRVAFDLLRHFITDIPAPAFKKIIRDAFNFPAPLVRLNDNVYVLELFHGPTLSFKDFGARFMARTMGYYLRSQKKKLYIFVATSGDTGSAVAHGFFNIPGVRVFILYPSGRVSRNQEKQLTTFGKNITAFEIKGNFDDCQQLAKQLLNDPDIRKRALVSSANSINIGRLLPQMFYYLFGWAQLQSRRTVELSSCQVPIFVVPSGNFGNICAGLFAKKLGLPAKKFIAAVNINSGVPEYLKTGRLPVKKTRRTLSSAMDVGLPSNFARILDLYGHNLESLQKDLDAAIVTDRETKKTIHETYEKYGYIADPHTAVGIAAGLRYRESGRGNDPIIVLSTAHPAKFPEAVEKQIKEKLTVPGSLRRIIRRKNRGVLAKNNPEDLKRLIGKYIKHP